MASQEHSGARAPKTLLGRFAENVLVGTIESLVRAGSRAVESLASDASKALLREQKKVDAVKKAVASWRDEVVGEITIEANEQEKGDRK